jgi:hypothetical protein
VVRAESSLLVRPDRPTRPDNDEVQHISLVALLVRHRRVTAPILILTLLGVAAAQMLAPSAYRAVGSVVLATPAQDPSRLPASIAQVSDAMTEMQRSDVRDSFLVDDASFSATMLDRTTLALAAEADRPAAAEETVLAAATWLRQEFTDRQETAGIPASDRLEGRLLTPTVVARRAAAGTYTAEAVLWIDGLAGSEENPYQASPVTSRLLTLWLTGTEGRATVEDRIGPNTGYLLVYDPRQSLPSIDIITEGSDAGHVVAAFSEIAAIMQLDLEGRQSRAQVPMAQRIFVDDLARPLVAEDISPAAAPLAVPVFLLGLTCASGTAALLEHRARRAPTSAAAVTA